MGKWRCKVCGYVFDEKEGDPGGGIPPGTEFDSLASDWVCPICGASKDAFERVGVEEASEPGQTTVSDVIVSELEKWGIGFVFGIPGTSSLGLVDALRRNERLTYVVMRHEENAAMAASAYNKLTGRIAVCLTIAGPGATNLATGLYDAKEDGASVLSLNGQVKFQYSGPGGLQEIDQDAFFRPICVFNNTIYDKSLTIKLLTMALKYATIRKGVAQLSVPNNVQKEALEASGFQKEMCLKDMRIHPDEGQIDLAAKVIDEAQRPVIVAGWGAYQYGEMVNALAERLKAPIVTTWRAKGVLPEDSKWLIGIHGGVGPQASMTTVASSDLMITLGVGFSSQTALPRNKKLVQVDIDPLRIGKYPYAAALWGDCGAVLPMLISRVGERERPWLPNIADIKHEWVQRIDREADDTSSPLRPPLIMKVLSEMVPEDAVISLDVGDNGWWFGRNFRIKRQKFVMSGYLGTMGFGLPGAIAAKLAYPDRTVFCITGDGGFQMAMADFVTAVKYKLPMVVVVLNNRQLGMIQVEQRVEGYPNFGTQLLNPDYAAFAESSGGIGFRVRSSDELRPAIERAMRSNRPAIVDVDTDPERFGLSE